MVFGTQSGWLLAATERCRQHDVWGTAYAVYEGVRKGDVRVRALNAILTAYRDGTATCRGNVRHILTREDWSENSAWEVTPTAYNTYQNGAYWGPPTNWYLYVLAQNDADACQQFVAEYVGELIEGDCRNKGSRGSPLECFHPETNHWRNPAYMTLVTCPLGALRRLGY